MWVTLENNKSVGRPVSQDFFNMDSIFIRNTYLRRKIVVESWHGWI
jgi:hypothetical protein